MKNSTIKEVTEIITRGISPKYVDKDGFIVINQKCIRNQSLNLELSRCSSRDKKIREDKFVRKWDVLINSTGVGTLGRVAQCIRETLDLTVDSHVTIVRPKLNIFDGSYFGFVLRNIECVFQDLGVGSTGQTELSRDAIGEITVNIPPLQTQQKIASILSSYDNLIENNNRRIAILEEMAQKLYREWFVKFCFSGHKEVKMVESELGLIPEGWEVVNATETMEINPRTTLAKEDEKPYLSMSYLSENSMVIKGNEYRSGNSGTKFKNNDTLFARITPSLENGKTGYVQFLDEENPIGFGSTEFIVLRSKSLTSEYVYCLARSNSFRDNAIKSMTGATGRQRVQNSCFDNYFFAQPTEELLEKFTDVVRPMFELVNSLHNKNLNLKRQRNLLLPKLISGKVPV